MSAVGAHNPQVLPIPVSLALERIKTIACSSRHTLILSFLGNVYSCGENSEGALGHGDNFTRSTFTLIQLPEPVPKFDKIAAGSGVIGSHSMAIDSEGFLYSWGVAYASGLGKITKPILSPELVDTFPEDEYYSATRNHPATSNTGSAGIDEEPDSIQNDRNLVKEIACGVNY